MAKVKPKVSAKRKAAVTMRLRLREHTMELKVKGPRTVQKTVRVPVEIETWLKELVKGVPGKVKPSVPAAIVQILEDAYRTAQKKSA